MTLTESENRILNDIKLVRKEYDILDIKSTIVYHTDIFTSGAGYIPFQLLESHIFGFAFRIVKDTIFLQIAFSNKYRKFYKNDIVRFIFENETIEFKLLGTNIKDLDKLNSSLIIINPEQVKTFLFDRLKRIETESKKNEIEYLAADLFSTLDNYNFSENFYQTVIKKLTNEMLHEYARQGREDDFTMIQNT